MCGEKRELLRDPLVKFVGGIQAGRTSEYALAATQEDFAVEHALGARKSGLVDASKAKELCRALSQVTSVELDGKAVSVRSQEVEREVEIVDEGAGYRLRWYGS